MTSPQAPAPAEGRRIGPYRLIEEIGRGAQGQVFLAEDSRLARKVALKILSSVFAPASEGLRRFQREAAAASKLDHPGICSIYDAGEAEGVPYIAMRYVEGETLARRIFSVREKALVRSETLAAGETGPGAAAPAGEASAGASAAGNLPSTRADIFRAAHLIEKAARALHAAHEAGLIHRDIKPGNIMVAPDEEPVILDFGLARDEASNLQSLTQSGDLLGTPAYMSPEQLLAQRIPLDRRTDIYSLGVSLYECLTLQRPFEAPTREGVYQKIILGDHPDPRRLNPHVSRDLKVVLETAMERDRDRRYKTALDLAEDLRRVRAYEPIQARPAGVLLRFQRWTQRNPVLATATLGLFLLLASGLGISLILLEQLSREKAETNRMLGLMEKERDEKGRALKGKEEALSAVEAEGAARARALVEKEQALVRAEGLYLTAQASNVLSKNPGLALLLAAEGASRQPGLLAKSVLLQALEANHEERTLAGHRGPVHFAVVSPDGRRARTGSRDGAALVWETASGRLLLVLRSHQASVNSGSWSPDGKRAVTASADRTAIVWDTLTGRRLAVLTGHEDVLFSVAFSPDGGRLLTASMDGTVRLWDAATGKESLRLEKHRQRAYLSALFSPGGERVLTITVLASPVKEGMSLARIWEARTGELAATLKGHQGMIASAAFSSGGDRVLGASYDRTARIWSAATGEVAVTFEGHADRVRHAVFSPDGASVATASDDLTARVWDASSGKLKAVLEGHEKPVFQAAFSPDGARVATASEDAAARIWDAASGRLLAVLRGHDGAITSMAWHPGGKWLITSAADGTARIWNANPDLSEMALVTAIKAPGGKEQGAHFSPDGRRVLFRAESAASCSLFDTRTKAEVASLREPGGLRFLGVAREPMAFAFFSPDGRKAVTVSVFRYGFSTATVWDAGTGKEVRGALGIGSPLLGADFSPDGRRMAGCFVNGGVHLFNLEGAGGGQGLNAVEGTARSVAFSPDGRLVLTVSLDPASAASVVQVWNAETGEPVRQLKTSISSGPGPARAQDLRPHLAFFNPGGQGALAALPERRDLFSVSLEGAPKLARLGGAAMAFDAVQVSPDGRKVVCVGGAPAARVLDASTGEVLAEIGGSGLEVLAAAFAPDSERLLTLSVALAGSSAVELWEVATRKRLLGIAGHGSPATSAAFHPDGKRIVTASEDGTARIWDADGGRELQRLAGHTGAVLSACFSPDGARVITASQDDSSAIWDAGSGERLITLAKSSWGYGFSFSSPWNDDAVFSPSGDRILTIADDTLCIWDGTTGKHLVTLGGSRGGPVVAARFSPDGERLLTAHNELQFSPLERVQGLLQRSLGAFPGKSGPAARLWEVSTGKLLATLRGGGERITALNFSPDGRQAVTASLGGGARLWEAASGRLLAELKLQGETVTAAFSPEGGRVLLVSRGGTAEIWEPGTDSRPTMLIGHQDALTAGSFSPSGKQALTASRDRTARIWNAATGEEATALSGHRAAVIAAEWSPDGRWVATGSEDRTVRLWDAASGAELIELSHPEGVRSAHFSQDGRWLLTVSSDSTARIWPMDLLVDPVAVARARKPRDLTPDERAAYEIGTPEERAAHRQAWDLRSIYQELEAILDAAAAGPLDPMAQDYLGRALGDVTRLLGERPGSEAARQALEYAERIAERTGRSDPDVLAGLGELQALHQRPREALLTVEEAAALPAARRSILSSLECRRQALHPDLISYASIDAAVEALDVLIAEGARWRFLRGRQEPSPGLEWTEPAFDDGAWETGRSGFGFGDGDDATILGDMQGAYTSLYIRHRFTVSEPARVEKLLLRVVADDGFVSYLNGVEVGRVRAGERGRRLPFDGVAGSLAVEPVAASELSIEPRLLRPGDNLLGIQGLNQSIQSSDFSLSPELVADLARDLEGDRKRFQAFLGAAGGEDAARRASYLEGRLLETAGRAGEAAVEFEKVLAGEAARPEPWLGLARALRAAGDPSRAEARLRQPLAAGVAPSEGLLDLWFVIAAVDLKRSLRELISVLPDSKRGRAGARADDFRWLLNELSAGGAIRINSGGEEHHDARGAVWGRDRLFRGSPAAATGGALKLDLDLQGTEDDALYQDQRVFLADSLQPCGYRLPLPPGRYRLTLHFAELPDPQRRLRALDVRIEGQEALASYAPPAAGSATADRKSFEIGVLDGFLDLDLIPRAGLPAIAALEIERLD